MSQLQIRNAIVGGQRLLDHRGLPGLRGPSRPALAPAAAASLAAHLGPALRIPLLHPAPALGQAVTRSVASIEPVALPPPPGTAPEPPRPLPARMPALPRLLPVPHARTLPRTPLDPGLVRAVEEALLAGGLWRDEDIAAACAAGRGAVAAALGGLSERGAAVLVALGHWRSRRRDACLREGGRTASARMLGGLLHGLSLSLADVADLLDLSEPEVADAPADLVRNALAVEVAPDTYRCPDAVRGGIIARLGPDPLTELGRRVLDALALGGPMRKAEAAAAAGIGRGSANRMIDRLVEEGWVRERGPDRYALA